MAFGAYEIVFWMLASIVFIAGIAVVFAREPASG
jgi:hypothetical protein